MIQQPQPLWGKLLERVRGSSIRMRQLFTTTVRAVATFAQCTAMLPCAPPRLYLGRCSRGGCKDISIVQSYNTRASGTCMSIKGRVRAMGEQLSMRTRRMFGSRLICNKIKIRAWLYYSCITFVL